MENIWTFPFGLCKILARVKGVLSGSGQKSDRCKFTCANMFRTHYVSTQTNKKFCSYVFEPQKKNQRIPKALQTISFSRNQFQRSAARSFYRGKLNVERFGFLWRNLYSRSRRCHFDVTGDPSDRSCYQQGWHQGIGSVSIPSCPCCRSGRVGSIFFENMVFVHAWSCQLPLRMLKHFDNSETWHGQNSNFVVHVAFSVEGLLAKRATTSYNETCHEIVRQLLTCPNWIIAC